MRKRPGWIVIVALAVTAIVGAAAVTQSVTQHSLEPIWTIGWIPAALSPPRSAGRRRRWRQRSRS